MGAHQRRKGSRGELDAAAAISELTGWEVTRRVRQHDGDSDLVGIPGWAVEVKRHKTATRGEVAGWWAQAVEQAKGQIPLLIYRKDRDEWRCVWPVAVGLVSQGAEMWTDYAWTVEGSPQAWAAVAREIA